MADEEPKRKAKDNPWYRLATLHGEPSTARDPIAMQNRLTWNRWMAPRIPHDLKAALLKKGWTDEELTPFSEDERKSIADQIGSSLEAETIDFLGTEFETTFFAVGFVFPSVDFRRATFSDSAFFGSAAFSGNADFSSAAFSGSAFGSAAFSGNADFRRATFSRNADFRRATFSHNAFFSSAAFSGDADFISAAFSVGAFFDSVVFSGDADFISAAFGRDTTFSSVAFSGDASFIGAAFSRDAFFNSVAFNRNAFFGSAAFSGNADFSSAAFSGIVLFSRAAFNRDADFGSAVLSRAADFSSVTFGGGVEFTDAEMKSRTSFAGVTFSEPPECFNTKLHEGTTWDDVQWPKPPKDRGVAQRFVAAYERLKLEMDRLKKHGDELDFFAREQQCRRVLLGPWSGLPIAIYGFLSDYGRSYGRPLLLLAVTVLVGAFPFAAALVGFWPPLMSDPDHMRQAIGISFTNTLGLLGKPLMKSDVLVALPDWLKMVATIQSILGIVLLFLFGLGVRNRFRMK